MTALFHDPTRLVATRLGPDTPPGLFRCYSHADRARWFYVTASGTPREAIVLESSVDRFMFDAWPLSPDLASWEGVALGEVELLVDVESGIEYASTRPPVGAVWIGRGTVSLGVKTETGLGSKAIVITTGETDSLTDGAAFKRWRFVQRDDAGKPETLFEHGAPIPPAAT